MVAQVCYKVSMPKLCRSRPAPIGAGAGRVDGHPPRGLKRASVRNVAREAGLSMGSLRHYFASQSELLCFAMQLVGDRPGPRGRPGAGGRPRRRAEQLLAELVPLDDERRASEVWLAFTGHALVDPAQRAIHQRIHDQLNGACATAITILAEAGLTAEGLDVALEASRLHALLDGLASTPSCGPGWCRRRGSPR